MTSPKQIEANRRNAQRSTGPRTPQGKSRSRLNAVTHGLTARTLILQGEDEPAYHHRLAAWTLDFAPCNDYEHGLVQQAVGLSWRLDRADRVEAVLRADLIVNGPAEEQRRRRQEAADLGRRLWPDPPASEATDPSGQLTDGARRLGPIHPDDPDDPARLVNRLEATAEGCRWLLDRWAGLRATLDAGCAWSPDQMLGAIRLVGKWPLAAVDDRLVLKLILDVSTLDGDRPDPFAALWEGLTPRQVESYRERLRGRGLPSAMARDEDHARQRLLDVIDEAVEALEVLETTHRRREAAQVGRLWFEDTPEGIWLLQQQTRATRGILRIAERFRAARRRGEAVTPTPSARRSNDRPSASPATPIDREEPGRPGPDRGDEPALTDPAPILISVPDPQPPHQGAPGPRPTAVHQETPTPDTLAHRPDPPAPITRANASRRIRLAAAVMLLMPFITAAGSPPDRPWASIRTAAATSNVTTLGPQSAARKTVDSLSTAIDPLSRPRNRQNEPICPRSSEGNRQNEPIFGRVSPVAAIRPPRAPQSANHSRGPPRRFRIPPESDRASSTPPAAWCWLPRALADDARRPPWPRRDIPDTDVRASR